MMYWCSTDKNMCLKWQCVTPLWWECYKKISRYVSEFHSSWWVTSRWNNRALTVLVTPQPVIRKLSRDADARDQ